MSVSCRDKLYIFLFCLKPKPIIVLLTRVLFSLFLDDVIPGVVNVLCHSWMMGCSSPLDPSVGASLGVKDEPSPPPLPQTTPPLMAVEMRVATSERFILLSSKVGDFHNNFS